PSKEHFFVYATREAPGCRQHWAQVADAGWVCLEHSEPGEAEPRALPEIGEDGILPFIYARHRRHKIADTPPIPVYRSLRQLNAGAEPVELLPAYGSYAFARRSYNHGKPAFITDDRRAVSTADLQRFEASEFSGRNLAEDPVAADLTLAWAVRWKTEIHAGPDLESEVLGRVPYHETVMVLRADPSGAWFEIGGDHPHRGGWLAAEDIRRWRPRAPDEPILAGAILLDVDLDQQVLTVWREDQPVFVTLVSSGKPGDRTPPGLYRIETKWAYGKMASLEDADDPYYVDAVPWVMYFDGRYALHAAFWHDLFGHQASHGCVNLSPRDAKTVFDLTTPTLPPGWLLVHEHAVDPGTLVRVRRDGHATPDRRPESR
ncbi:MAG: L,D-transpeptidase family protein, partial [Myxococcales bacterium]|nr:L,D-transpeptidase family protein [Myxococcales bacterium]